MNNLMGQNHCGIKSGPGICWGFKNFRYAATTIASIKLFHRIRKEQFSLGRLRHKDKAAPAI